MLTRPFQRISFSAGAAFILLLLCYWFDNAAFPLGEQSGYLTLIETVIQKTGKKTFDREGVVFINMGYDLSLVETEHGKEVITDRKHLADLLQDLRDAESRYIIMDIRLETGLNTPYDTLLLERIKSLGERIVVAKHWNYQYQTDYPLMDDADSTLRNRAAYCDYTTSIFYTAFEKYQYLQPGGPSAALQAYTDLTGHRLRKHGIGDMELFFTEGNSLCFNALFIGIPDNFSGGRYRSDGNPVYWNLNEDFYGEDSKFERTDLKALCHQKIIVIGNFIDDLHNTYMGNQPGPFLSYLAFENLMRGRHRISWLQILVLFLFFMGLFLEIVRGRKLIYLFPFVRKSTSKLLHFVISLIGYTLLLALISWLSYLFFQRPVGTFFPTVVFTVTDLIFRYENYEA